MKTFGRLIRRYVLAIAVLVLLLAGLGAGLLGWLGWRYTVQYQAQPYTSSEIAAAMVQKDGQLDFGPAHPRNNGCRGTPGPWSWMTTVR